MYAGDTMKRGSKGHVEFDWSSSLQEKIKQFEFQINRCQTTELENLQKKYEELIDEALVNQTDNLIKLYNLILSTRSILHGKGLRTISYMMLKSWEDKMHGSKETHSYCYCNGCTPHNKITDCQNDILLSFVIQGSWKDIKYFCDYCIHNGWKEDHDIIKQAICLMNSQIRIDLEQLNSNTEKPRLSFASKWAPREGSKFHWLFVHLAKNFYAHYLEKATTPLAVEKATKKAYMEYRKTIAKLNMALNTVEINQCENQWSSIDFHKVSKTTVLLQMNAFLNTNKLGIQRTFTKDREQCATSFMTAIENKKIGKIKVEMYRVVQEAFELWKNKKNIQAEIYEKKKEWINKLWLEQGIEDANFKKLTITMVDMSMEQNAQYAAIGIACKIAENSTLGNGILTFSGNAKWINFESCKTFMDKIEKIDTEGAVPHINTNFYNAYSIIMDVIKEIKMTPEEIKNITLIILSNMQIDPEFPFYKSMHETMEEKGSLIWGDNGPIVCFWNLMSTNGFPVQGENPKVILNSGWNPHRVS